MYIAEEVIEPFWAEYSTEASGRDPLAIQNSSVVIYSKMIVGITNVTNRIRYNGFFCWIFDTIAKNIKKRNSLPEQLKFSRRAELLLAFIMVKNFRGITGISGSNYAVNNLRSRLSLKRGADWENKSEGGSGLYWRFKAGIFGQYYSGVMRDLNLINHPKDELNIYTLTKSGSELAKAFENNIPLKARTLFWESVSEGFVDEIDLLELNSFALHLVPNDSDELLIYEQLLLAKDDRKLIPTYNRKDTIKLLLEHLAARTKGVNDLMASFLSDNYQKHVRLKRISFTSATTWYLYEMNELLHLAFEYFHACFLYTIETYPTLLEKSVDSLNKDTAKTLKSDKIDSKSCLVKDLIKKLENDNHGTYYYCSEMEASFKVSKFGETLKNAIYLLFNIYLENKIHLKNLEEFGNLHENNFNRSGYAIEILNDLVQGRLHETLVDYIQNIILAAINRHLYSSYSKSRIGQALVHNYMIEGQMVWQLRQTLPSRTNPRLQNAIQYMTDIGWIQWANDKYSITNQGTTILQSI
jgi:hypothetical protein